MINLYLVEVMIIDSGEKDDPTIYEKCFVIANNDDEAIELALKNNPKSHMDCQIYGKPQNMNFMADCIIFPDK